MLNRNPFSPTLLMSLSRGLCFFSLNSPVNLPLSSSNAMISGLSSCIVFVTSSIDCLAMWLVPTIIRFLYFIVVCTWE